MPIFYGKSLFVVLSIALLGAVTLLVVNQGRQEVRTYAAGTTLNITLLLHGLGTGGDSANSNASGNNNPLRPQREILIDLYNQQNQLVLTKQATVNFNSTNGNFTGVVDVGTTVTTGVYTVKIKTDQYLRALVPGIQSITAGQATTLPATTLITGDINNDNAVNIVDYNILIGCYSDLSPAVSCTASQKLAADITDDGSVNQFDYNLFLRESTNIQGEPGGGTVPTATPTQTAATPTPTRTPTPTPISGGGGAFCSTFPALPSVKPDASNTGPRVADSQLTASGGVTLSTAGATFSNRLVSGTITVAANNVTIQDVKVMTSGLYGIKINSGVTGTKILYSEIGTPNGSYTGFSGQNTTICGSHIYGWENLMTVYGGNTIQANYMEKAQGGPDAHHDGIEVYGGSGDKIWGNNIRLTNVNGGWHGETNAINITAWNGNISNVEVNGNWIGGGGYVLGVRQQNSSVNTNIKITNNRWYRNSYQWGTHDVQPGSAVTTWSGNVFDDNGQVINK